jgi:hypothetical protein
VRWAIVTLLPFCLVTVGLSAYATMPSSYSGRGAAGRPRPGDPSFNILFFGHFYDLPYDEYEAAMEEMMNDPSRTYQLQVREVYTLGVFLAKKKYRALRMAYMAFIVGLTASGIVALAMAMFRSRG